MEASPMPRLRNKSLGPSSLKPIVTKGKSIEEYDMVTVAEEPLSPTARLFHDSRFDVHAVAVMACKTRIEPQPVKEKLVHTLLKHPRFTSLMVVDEENLADMKWVQTKVDLDQHIIIPEVDETQLESPDKFVEDYIYNLSKTSLDKCKPLWDLHIINVKTRDAESKVVFRVHHSLGDGTSLISLLLACTRQTADESKLPTIPTKKRRPTPSGYSTKEGPFMFLGAFWLFIIMLFNTAVDVFMFIITTIFLKDTKTPISAVPDSQSNGRRIVHRIISLDDLKFVKNAMDVTINDVALGLTQAGLSKYLNRRYAVIGGKDKGDTERNNNLPIGIRLRSCLVINLRQSAGIEDLADMMENGIKGKRGWGNWFGYVLLPFKIALCDDPLNYVKEAKATVDRKKRSFEALFTLTMAELVIKFFGIKVATAVTLKVFSNSTICFTNLVGPQEEIGFCGKPMTYFAPSAYGQPSACMINFQSYIDKMIIAVSVDETAISDPQQLLDDFEDSLNLIKDAVVKRGLGKNMK
ncbi:wax ester synthase/diacylglycerol acyltransferase 11-like [Lycium barbarum]|uniref:wax ester synthase/diacylglycerol acyltransferase 11-like n=1 Tax=Lycium barbarum TaxID=112863 RepID=UPI00293E09F5|nr:wax ester synthase/diacylglycerol acyltransferase 11-like [Lycium barbarum]